MDDKNNFEKVNILLVDDDRRNLTALAAVLDNPEYNLVLAENGSEALQHLLHLSFAVVILDVMMPEMDGFELARLIKSRKKTENTPIIFLTAFHTDEQDIFQGYDLGAFDYLIKPAHPHILRAKVSVFANLFLKAEAEKHQYLHLAKIAAKGVDSDELPEWGAEYRAVLAKYVGQLRSGKTVLVSPLEAVAKKLVNHHVKTPEIVSTHLRVVKELTMDISQSDADIFADYAKMSLLELLGCVVEQMT